MAGICYSTAAVSSSHNSRIFSTTKCCSNSSNNNNSKNQTPQFLKFVVNGVTEMLRLFSSATNNRIEMVAPEKKEEELMVSGVDDVLGILKSDYDNAYFVTEGFHAELEPVGDKKGAKRTYTKRKLSRKKRVVLTKRNWRPSGLLAEYLYGKQQEGQNPVQPSALIPDLNEYPADSAGQDILSCKTKKLECEDLSASTSRVIPQRKPPETVSGSMHDKDPAWSSGRTEADASEFSFGYVSDPNPPQSAQ